MDTDYADDIDLLANAPTQAESLLYSLEQTAGDIGLSVNANKMEYMCVNWEGTISILNGYPLKLVDKFTYLGSSVSSTESNVNIWLAKVWTAINRSSIIWKSNLSNKIKCNFFQAAVMSILPYTCTNTTLCMHHWQNTEKKLDRNCTRML